LKIGTETCGTVPGGKRHPRKKNTSEKNGKDSRKRLQKKQTPATPEWGKENIGPKKKKKTKRPLDKESKFTKLDWSRE